jgi:hypothetical protein
MIVLELFSAPKMHGRISRGESRQSAAFIIDLSTAFETFTKVFP